MRRQRMAFGDEIVIDDVDPEMRIGHQHCNARQVLRHDYVFSVLRPPVIRTLGG